MSHHGNPFHLFVLVTVSVILMAAILHCLWKFCLCDNSGGSYSSKQQPVIQPHPRHPTLGQGAFRSNVPQSPPPSPQSPPIYAVGRMQQWQPTLAMHAESPHGEAAAAASYFTSHHYNPPPQNNSAVHISSDCPETAVTWSAVQRQHPSLVPYGTFESQFQTATPATFGRHDLPPAYKDAVREGKFL